MAKRYPGCSLTDSVIRTEDLPIQRYAVCALVDAGFPSADVVAEIRQRLDSMAYELTYKMRTVAKVLQDKRVIASYPASLWDAIKRALNIRWLRYKMVDVLLTEHLLFPDYQIPRGMGQVRVYTHSDLGESCGR